MGAFIILLAIEEMANVAVRFDLHVCLNDLDGVRRLALENLNLERLLVVRNDNVIALLVSRACPRGSQIICHERLVLKSTYMIAHVQFFRIST